MKTYKYHNLIKINQLACTILALILTLSIQGWAQSRDKNTLLQMIDEDRTTIDAIAGYDQDIQRHVLQVAQTPDALNKIEELQQRSQNQFRSIIENYDRDTQSAFYELARYPNLISDLVRQGMPSNSEVNHIVLNYPDEIHEIARNYGRRYFDVFVRIDQLNNQIDGAFQQYLEPFGSRTRESVNVLLAYPEIVSALVDDMAFTALLGKVYREDPNWVMHNLNQISEQLAQQNREDLESYQNQIQNDPEAYNEMLDASERFARENNEVRYLERSEPVVEVRVINNYPYWFGYPYWYSYPHWRPRPYYYHTGFYRNPYGNVVFVGLPSYHFIHWQTRYHPTSFPHLSYNYYNYYENHYAQRYRDHHRPVPHHGFYSSIERNVINNPRVNNSTLRKIDHQRGNNIVRKPNKAQYESGRRGSSGVSRQSETVNSQRRAGTSGTTSRRGTETINSNRNEQNNSGTTRGTVNRRGTEQPNSGKSGSAVNRRETNTVNPGRSEGPVNRRSSGSGSGTIRREATPAPSTSPGGTSTGRSREGTSINRINNESTRPGNGIYSRSKVNAAPSSTGLRTSSGNGVNRTAAQQRSANVQMQQRSANAEAQQRSANVQMQQRSANAEAQQRSANVQMQQRSANVQSQQRSANVQSQQRSANVQSQQRSANVQSQQRSANVQMQQRSANAEAQQRSANVQAQQRSESVQQRTESAAPAERTSSESVGRAASRVESSSDNTRNSQSTGRQR